MTGASGAERFTQAPGYAVNRHDFKGVPGRIQISRHLRLLLSDNFYDGIADRSADARTKRAESVSEPRSTGSRGCLRRLSPGPVDSRAA
ncbi:hypothetical protein DPEC_G00150680 [Dallia pectoralis]|uniref:Uncharacterized protein n=1 Tax=Dallia pectoralis TaxID=75939 RepID=A0ACC2GJ00_DALPE|nr:hypothetical protein DPEC_G00150680 [Dallia pectoralis]